MSLIRRCSRDAQQIPARFREKAMEQKEIGPLVLRRVSGDSGYASHDISDLDLTIDDEGDEGVAQCQTSPNPQHGDLPGWECKGLDNLQQSHHSTGDLQDQDTGNSIQANVCKVDQSHMGRPKTIDEDDRHEIKSSHSNYDEAPPKLPSSLPPLDRRTLTKIWLEGDAATQLSLQSDIKRLSPWPPLLTPSPALSQAEYDEAFSWPDNDETDLDALSENHVLKQFTSALSALLFAKYRSYTSGYDQVTPCKQGFIYGQSHDQSSGSSHGNRSAKRKSDESSDGNDEHRSLRRRTSGSSEATEEKLLACPFCKNDPRRYRDCYKYILRDISRVKQHLARRHRVPIHCPSCSILFESEAERDEHIRARSCEVLMQREWDGINEFQKRQLERRISVKKTKEENWYIIYEFLFPGAIRPRSPYVDTPLSNELLGLQEFALIEGSSIIAEFAQVELPESLRPQEQEIQNYIQTIFQNAVGLLLERYAASRPTNSDNPTIHRRSTGQLGSPESGYRSNDAEPSNQSGQNSASEEVDVETQVLEEQLSSNPNLDHAQTELPRHRANNQFAPLWSSAAGAEEEGNSFNPDALFNSFVEYFPL